MKKLMLVVPIVLVGGYFFPVPAQSQEKSGLDGAALIKDRCSTCHATSRIDKAKKDKKGWEANVDRMIAKGAKLNKQERDAVVAYLSSR